MSTMELFFSSVWNRAVYNCRLCIVIIFIIWSAAAVGQAYNLKPQPKQELTLPQDNYLVRAYDNIQKNFPVLASDGQDANMVHFFFGVKSLNQDSVDRWNPDDLGKVELVGEMDISDVESQKSLQSFCE